ncbi:MAG: hypothetical protein K9K88_04785 [Desulfobacterales bacterium]|nr:hypothetical protein [Desulfobacterales bacterium]
MQDRKRITLYSGGHRGTEAEFGRQAEIAGLEEVNFTFPGHACQRTRGLVELSAEDLNKGDVSMEIVSMRMNRSFSKADKIRKVIQSIFHMVNRGYQVFTVGWIQDDGTVKGGTGWAVELAKLFNRPLSVFDQDHNAWFSWKENQWQEDLPTIGSETFVGTGTRNLTAEGKAAIQDLFQRSFGPR